VHVIPALSVALAATLWAGARRYASTTLPQRLSGATAREWLFRRARPKLASRILLGFGTLMVGEAPMAAPRDALHHLIDGLPDAELGVALRFLKFLSQEPVEPPLAASIRRGITEADAGRTIICHSYDEMVEKVLGKE